MFGGDEIFGGPLTLGQFGFMAEAEGQDDLVDTPTARFNAALNDIKEELSWAKGNDYYDATDTIDSILWNHGINPASLTASQISRIEKAIA